MFLFTVALSILMLSNLLFVQLCISWTNKRLDNVFFVYITEKEYNRKEKRLL